MLPACFYNLTTSVTDAPKIDCLTVSALTGYGAIDYYAMTIDIMETD